MTIGFAFLIPTAAFAQQTAPALIEQSTVKRERYLGIVTEPVPEPLAAQLKAKLPAGRGLIVKRVLSDSPAAKAGVQLFDVIVAADDAALSTPDQLKELVTSLPVGKMLRLQLIRETKTQSLDILPGERTVSRIIHRHAADNVAGQSADTPPAADGASLDVPAYSVGVQTRDGRQFQVDVRLSADGADDVLHAISGTSAEILARLKSLPEPVRQSVARQIRRVSEDRQTLRTVQFRFQPRRQGNRQVLTATLRRPHTNGTIKSMEWLQPVADTPAALPLDKLLAAKDFAAQLEELDPAVRERLEAILKTVTLPAGMLKVEASQ